MFFRNLTLFRFQADTAADLARLAEVLPDHRLRPCGPMEMCTNGFVAPVGRGDDAPLVHTMKSCTLFTAGGEDKLLPAAVINDELRKKVDAIADEEGRKVGGRERKRIKDDLFTELLPRAFVRSSRLSAYVDTANHWLVIDTSSRKLAEHLLTMTREALGSFPAVPMAPEESPRVLMTDWLANGTMPAGLALGDECELRDPATATGAIAMCRRQDMDAEEIKEHLRNGKQVFKLGLVFDDRISFVLGEDLVVRKLRFLDVVIDELATAEDAQSELDASFALMALELQRLLAKFAEWFGLQTDAPLHLHRQDAPPGMEKSFSSDKAFGAAVKKSLKKLTKGKGRRPHPK
jgi:recombination associated protein RdgC